MISNCLVMGLHHDIWRDILIDCHTTLSYLPAYQAINTSQTLSLENFMTDIDYSNNIDNSVNYNMEYFLIKEPTNKKQQM